MKYGIKVYDTYACSTWQGIAWLFEEEHAIRYDSEEQARYHGQYISPEYRFEVVPLKPNLKELEEENAILKAKLKEMGFNYV